MLNSNLFTTIHENATDDHYYHQQNIRIIYFNTHMQSLKQEIELKETIQKQKHITRMHKSNVIFRKLNNIKIDDKEKKILRKYLENIKENSQMNKKINKDSKQMYLNIYSKKGIYSIHLHDFYRYKNYDEQIQYLNQKKNKQKQCFKKLKHQLKILKIQIH